MRSLSYLRKDSQRFHWRPEWQGPGEGNHAGPIRVSIASAGRPPWHKLVVLDDDPTGALFVASRLAIGGAAYQPPGLNEPASISGRPLCAEDVARNLDGPDALA